MCTFTPHRHANCICPRPSTGAIEMCSPATRNGEICGKPARQREQKGIGACLVCLRAGQTGKVPEEEAVVEPRRGGGRRRGRSSVLPRR